ncbi:MAG: ATP-binding cassette domain-containing protein [Anaerolineales bacterium]|nr:ATP-binding cassette domain-containing protein [Anaerolineales bacterium]
MLAIRLDKVSVIYNSDPIFEDLSWEIHDDQVVGLIGPNGSGKSTLLKLIHGDFPPNSGFTNHHPGVTVGYLPQEPDLNQNYTVWQEVFSAHSELSEVEIELENIEIKLGSPEIYNDEVKLARALDYQARLLERFTKLGGPGYDGHIKSTLKQLGFTDPDFTLTIQALSGGQKKLVGLAKLLILQPKILLLDEPDNHLDLDGKDFLANFIQNYPGGIVIVSHDRYLLDLVVDEIVDLEDGRLTQYPGNYSEYAYEKQTRLLRQQQVFHSQQKEIQRLEQSAKRLLTWGHIHDNQKFIKRGRNILKRIDRMEKVHRPILERKQMRLELAGWRGSNKVLEIEDLEKTFSTSSGKFPIFSGLKATIWHGDRAGLIGPNGSGKSLLFKLILAQEKPTNGHITLGPSVKIGYYAQEHETLVYERSLIDTIRYAAPLSDSDAVAFLGRFLFTYEQARGTVSTLSGGERSRLQIALLMLSGANFLMLDEPTNNLDIASAEILEAAIADFDGTVLAISHDRYFLDRVVNKVLEIHSGVIKEHIGNFNQYQEQKLRNKK